MTTAPRAAEDARLVATGGLPARDLLACEVLAVRARTVGRCAGGHAAAPSPAREARSPSAQARATAARYTEGACRRQASSRLSGSWAITSGQESAISAIARAMARASPGGTSRVVR